jgi:hypothetical protein
MSLIFIPSDGLGNLLFQHHAAYTFAKKQGLDLCAMGYYYDVRPKFGEYKKLFAHVKMLGDETTSEKTADYEQDPTRARINNVIKLGVDPRTLYVEQGHAYSPIPTGARILSGYFQSWKYFDEFRTEIKDVLRTNEAELWSKQKAKFQGGICVHVRRGGDAAGRPEIHPLTSSNYYDRAMALFPGAKFLVFCEEPALIKDWAIWSGRDVEFVDEPGALATMFLMSCCDHFILANSSLSLNAYYLRDQETASVVAPSDWFGPAGPKFNIHDIIDKGTII